MQNSNQAPPGLQHINGTSRKGDLAEQFVKLLATWKGAEVFANINCTGDTDIVLLAGTQSFRIDVKLAQLKPLRTDKHGHIRNPSWGCARAGDVPAHIYPVVVIPCGDVLDWKVRWHLDRYPEGLADFWSKDYLINSTKQTDG